MFNAYNTHHNLVLRPDDFWLAVLSQFSLYVNANAELLRKGLVGFDRKRELVVTGIGSLATANYDSLCRRLCDEISKNVLDSSLLDMVLPNFTTSTQVDKTVACVTLMATMQKYFDYKMCLCCGIPYVTLLGTVQDYQTLLSKVNQLVKYDYGTGLMMRWTKVLVPVFEELLRTVETRKPNLDFWSKVCSQHSFGSGPEYLSGWITCFACFDESGVFRDNKETHKKIKSEWPVLDTNDVPPLMSSVPVTVDDNGLEFKTMAFAGSFSSTRVNDTTVAPRYDWVLCKDTRVYVNIKINNIF